MDATAQRAITVLHTGGTLGMVRGPGGAFVTEQGALATALAELSELRDARMPRITVEEFDTLLDSSDMQPSDWGTLAKRVAHAFAGGADGVVVLHGTDTMAYSAAALSFLLPELPGPVILTGSQLPLIELRSDGRDNLLSALLLAATPGWAEVAVFFGGRLLRGNRTTKVSTSGFDAFDSPNLPALAQAGVNVVWQQALLRPAHPQARAQMVAAATQAAEALASAGEVVALRLFPGMGHETLERLLRDPVRGVVLETYGSGNAPARNTALMRALQAAVARGVVVVNVTQCLRGGVRMGDYATGRALADAGVVGGADMTAEAALTKLLVLLSRLASPAQVAAAFTCDLAGELSAAAATR
jgi:L-asparaginase